MNLREFIHSALWYTATAGITILITTLFYKGVETHARKASETYVRKNLLYFIKAQEDELHIEHFGVPHVEFLPIEEIKHPSHFGEYEEENNTISFVESFAITPKPTMVNFFIKLAYPSEIMYDLERATHHELGHFYTDSLSEHLTGNNWPGFSTEITVREEICLKVLAEGTAEYFERKMKDDTIKYYPVDHFLDFETMIKHQKKFFYEGGFQIVGPIIDAYGITGITYIIQHTPKTIQELRTYQQKALEDLALTEEIKP